MQWPQKGEGGSFRAVSKAGVWLSFVAYATSILDDEGLQWVANWQLPRLLFSFFSCVRFGPFFLTPPPIWHLLIIFYY